MSSDMQVLVEKFSNFKKFVKENAKSPSVKMFESYTDKQFFGFSHLLVKMHEEKKLDDLVTKTVNDLEIDPIHTDKIMRYYLCFIDYVKAINQQSANTKEEAPELIKL